MIRCDCKYPTEYRLTAFEDNLFEVYRLLQFCSGHCDDSLSVRYLNYFVSSIILFQ